MFEVNRQQRKISNLISASTFLAVILTLAVPSFSQSIAVFAPAENEFSSKVEESLTNALETRFRMVDADLARTAFDSLDVERPYNLTKEDGVRFGMSSGCNYFVLILSNRYRRTSFEREEYYDAFAAYFLVSGRTGRLVEWKFVNFEEDNPKSAADKLLDSVRGTARQLRDRIIATDRNEIAEESISIEELPLVGSPDAREFRPPLPYRRMRPKYTRLAGIHDVVATVDVAVDIGETGKVLRTEILRWAGFGLDEAVRKTVHSMNWRPAERKGEKVAMRILLRYNFKDLAD